MSTPNDPLFMGCMLDKEELFQAVTKVCGMLVTSMNCESLFHRLVLENQVYIEPPSVKHLNYGPGKDGVCRGEWLETTYWTATVSSSVRTKKNKHGYDTVGRGMGNTPLLATLRAIVDSFPNPRGGG